MLLARTEMLLLEWFSDIDRADKLIPDGVVYVSSVLAFTFLPAHLGRKIWWFVGWFLFLNLSFLLDLWNFLDWRGPFLFIAIGQAPWVLIMLDLVFKGKLSPKIAAIPMRELLLWQVTRLMGLHFALAIYGGYAPEEFSLQVGFSEVITGLGALALYLGFRPNKGWYRTLLVFWNTYGLTSMLTAEFRTVLANPNIPKAHFSREIFQYMTAYPQNWCYAFWFPIAIGIHCAIYFKMYHSRSPKPIT